MNVKGGFTAKMVALLGFCCFNILVFYHFLRSGKIQCPGAVVKDHLKRVISKFFWQQLCAHRAEVIVVVHPT